MVPAVFTLIGWAAPTPGRPARRTWVMGVLALLAAGLVLLAQPAVGRADPFLTVDAPSSVTMPDGALLKFDVSPAEAGVGVWDGGWNYVDGCTVDHDTGKCEVRVLQGVLNGGAHPYTVTLHVQAIDSFNRLSNVVTKTVTFDPPDWQVSLDMPDGVSMPDDIPIALGTTPSIFSGHSVSLLDADTNGYAGFSCATEQACSGTIPTGWFGGSPVTKHYRAELKDLNTVMASAEKTVVIYPPNIGVTVTVPSFVLPGHSYTVKVTNTYNRWTPYTIYIRDANGSVVGWCSVDSTTCEFTATAGATGSTQSFTAEVSYGSTIISKTSPARVEAADPATAGSIDGIDITALAAAFGSAENVCTALLYFPGTNLSGHSTTDQWEACDVVAHAANPTAAAAIRAALDTLTAVGIAGGSASLLAWLQHYAWENWGTTAPPHPPGPPPGHPADPPTSTPAPVASAVDALADSLTARNAAVAALGAAAATEIARRCLNLTGDDGISSDDCKNLPIFMPGSDYVGATNHRIQALASHPAWVKLTRRIGPTDPWYKSQVECLGLPSYLDCDEFPENRTYQGGSRGAAVHRPSLEPVNWIDNQQLGGRFGNFLVGCGIKDGEAFLEVPLPPILGIPTQTSICNP